MMEACKKLALFGDAWVLWLLVLASVGSLGVILERWRAYRRDKLDFPRFMEAFSKHMGERDLDAARAAARQAGGLEARVALAGLENAAKGPAAAEGAMTSRLILEREQLEKNLIFLGTLGNNAPFVGLFGTVLGIIKAFNDLAISGSSGAAVVMAGISSALIATAFGILVAIPAVAANNAFKARLKARCANAQSLIHLMHGYLA